MPGDAVERHIDAVVYGDRPCRICHGLFRFGYRTRWGIRKHYFDSIACVKQYHGKHPAMDIVSVEVRAARAKVTA